MRKTIGDYIRSLSHTSTTEVADLRAPKKGISKGLQTIRRWVAGHRIIAVTGAVLIVFSVAYPVLSEVMNRNRYTLSSAATQLVGKTDPQLTKQLTYDASAQTYYFNKDAVKQYNPLDKLKNQTGAANQKGAATYSLEVPNDASQGVTYHDTNSQLSFKLVPQFKAMAGKLEQGRLVFPMSGRAQAVYTLKNNGLKEDIVVSKATENAMRFTYKLDLPKTLEVRDIPGSDGAIGIYSAEPTLYGDISYGSDSDQALIEKARENAKKDYLVFGLPAPVVTTLHNKTPDGVTARFELNNNSLTVVAEGLKNIQGAFSIDPSVTVSSTTDFTTSGNNEGMIDFNTSGQITRGGLTGGGVGTWNSTNSFAVGRESLAATAYNGYLYIAAGKTRTPNASYDDIQYAAINSDGTVGSWSSAGTLPVVSSSAQIKIYNGYMYFMGTTGVDYRSWYAPIRTDGYVGAGSWHRSADLPVNLWAYAMTVASNHIYVLGGSTGSIGSGPWLDTVYYADLHADGSIGSWSSTSSFTSGRVLAVAEAYNGYMYLIGGGAAGYFGQVQYAAIKADGSLGAWQTTTTFANGRYGMAAYAYNGYMYLMGGAGYRNDVQYAPILANGALGNWQATTSFTTGRTYVAGAAYNGYIYVVGGLVSTSPDVESNSVQYAKIDPPGANSQFVTTGNTALPNNRNLASSVAYNGYVYVLGGSSGTGRTASYNNVLYAPINSSGNVGSWSTGSTFVGGKSRVDGGVAAYNGYLYYFAGMATGDSYSSEVQYAQINTNGSLGTWTLTTPLSVGRFGPVAWAYNGRMYTGSGYHLGVDTACGSVTSHYCSDLWMATINSDGSLGSWVRQTDLPSINYGGRIALSGRYIYSAGGDGGSCSAVYVASMGMYDGVVTSFNTLTQMNACRTSFMLATSNGYLYAWGNNPDRAPNVNTGQYVKLRDDGAFVSDSGCGSVWCNIQPMTASTLGGRTGLIYQGMMYTFGGATASAASTSVETATINNGGSSKLSGWTSQTSLPHGLANHGSFAYNGRLYVLGGNSSSSDYYNEVYYAPINTDGSLGSWVSTTSFPTPRSGVGVAVYKGYVYVIGGRDASTRYNYVHYAPINTDGTIGTWTATTSFTTGRSAHSVVQYKGYLYVIGGQTGTGQLNTVQHSAINSDGTIGTWTADTAFSGGRYSLMAVAVNGYLYVMGGTDGTSLSDVQLARLNSDGSVADWGAGASFEAGISRASAVVYNGYIYVVGGYGTSQLRTVQYASVRSNGLLSSWDQLSASDGNLPNTQYAQATVAYNGYLYSTGAYAGGGYYDYVRSSPIQSINRTGSYSKLIDLGVSTNVRSITLGSNLLDDKQAVSFRAAGSDGVFGAQKPSYAITTGADVCTAGNVNNTRYLWVTVQLDDSEAAFFADASMSAAHGTDITVNYSAVHPDTDKRLRNGRSLQTGNISALDTCQP